MGIFSRSSSAPKRSAIEGIAADFEPFFAGLPLHEQYGAMELVRAIAMVTRRCNFQNLAGGLMKFVLRLVPHSSGKHVGERLIDALDRLSPTFRARYVEKFGRAEWESQVADARSALS